MRTSFSTTKCLAVLALGLSTRLLMSEPFRCETETRANQWNVWFGTNKVLVYSFDPSKFKPYVKELRTISGQNVLRDAPFDHLHHHGLMYAIRVNGLNFWEETPGNGVQKPVSSPPPEFSTDSAGQPQARITQVLHWVRSEDAFLPDTLRAALLIEHRTLTLSINQPEREVALEWQSDFEVGTKTNSVALSGSNYNGLGVRFLQPLDPFAMHNLGGRIVDLSGNRQDLSTAPWAAVSFELPGQATTFAMVGHTANVRGDARFFSMRTPFAYLSATQGLDREALTYHAGDKFSLRYLILLYAEKRSDDSLDRRAEAWRTRP